MSTTSTGHSTSSIPHVLVVHAPGGTDVWQAVLGGLIGGLTVLVGVVLAEWMTRVRERRSRINEAHFTALRLSVNFTVEDPEAVTPYQWLQTIVPLQLELSRLSAQAKWPMRNAKQIREEVEQILDRLRTTSATMLERRERVDPTELIGDRLDVLVRGEKPRSGAEDGGDPRSTDPT